MSSLVVLSACASSPLFTGNCAYLKIKKTVYLFLIMCVWVHVLTYRVPQKPEVWDLLELELHVSDCLTWALGTEHRSFVRAAWALKCGAVNLAASRFFFLSSDMLSPLCCPRALLLLFI